MLCTACSNPFKDEETTNKGTIGFVPGALGAISVEEPQAALVARDILSAGGTAADAATAIGFALSVTMPSAASIGGGGLCIVRDARGEKPQVIDFLPRAPKQASASAPRPSAVPGLPRGLFLLHSRYGELKWAQVVAPAETLARFGYPISRAFAVELAKVAPALVEDKISARVFRRKDGRVVGEGDYFKQPDLAGLIGRMRRQGVGDFYIGSEAANFVEGVKAAGGTLSIEDLRAFQPAIREPISLKWESNTVWHFAGPPASGGAVVANMMSLLMADARFENADEVLREHLLVETAKRAFANRMKNLLADGNYRTDPNTFVSEQYIERAGGGINDNRATPFSSLVSSPVDWPETPAAVSFSVMDIRGGAVACTLTMNNRFGTGRMVDGYGVVLAAAPDQRGRTYTPVGPALLTSELFNRSYGAFAASGGVAAPTALVNVIARAGAGPQTLLEAMRAPRTHYAGVPDKVFVERSMDAKTVEALKARGHNVAISEDIGRVTATYCNTGIPNKKGISCASASDPRGHGVAIGGT